MDDPVKLRRLAQGFRTLAGIHGEERRNRYLNGMAERWESRAAEIERGMAGDKPGGTRDPSKPAKRPGSG